METSSQPLAARASRAPSPRSRTHTAFTTWTPHRRQNIERLQEGFAGRGDVIDQDNLAAFSQRGTFDLLLFAVGFGGFADDKSIDRPSGLQAHNTDRAQHRVRPQRRAADSIIRIIFDRIQDQTRAQIRAFGRQRDPAGIDVIIAFFSRGKDDLAFNISFFGQKLKGARGVLYPTQSLNSPTIAYHPSTITFMNRYSV